MSSSKKIYHLMSVYLSEAQNIIPLHTLHTVYVYTVLYCIFTYSQREGEGGVESERRQEGQQFTKLG
jgi:hypothetical protein